MTPAAPKPTLIDKLTAAIQKLLGPDEPALLGGLIGTAVVIVILALTGSLGDGISSEELGLILAPLGITIPVRQAVSPAAGPKRRARVHRP